MSGAAPFLPARGRRPSLTRHVMLWSLGALAVVWASFVWVGYRTGVHEADELTDGHLASVAGLLLMPPFFVLGVMLYRTYHETFEKRGSDAGVRGLAFFFGIFGAHRFYVGRYESGLFYMFTFGCFFVGWAYDFFILPALVEEKNKKVFHQQMLETGNSLLFDSGEYGYGGGGGGGGGGGYGGSAAAPYYPVSYSGGQHQGMYYPQGGRYDQSPSSSPPRPPRSRPPPRFFNLKHTRPTHAAALPGYY